jgi:hypothetical protein
MNKDNHAQWTGMHQEETEVDWRWSIILPSSQGIKEEHTKTHTQECSDRCSKAASSEFKSEALPTSYEVYFNRFQNRDHERPNMKLDHFGSSGLDSEGQDVSVVHVSSYVGSTSTMASSGKWLKCEANYPPISA